MKRSINTLREAGLEAKYVRRPKSGFCVLLARAPSCGWYEVQPRMWGAIEREGVMTAFLRVTSTIKKSSPLG